MKRVFISYKSEEANRAKAIRKYLEGQGISCWMAPRNIPIGSNYASEIPKAIKACGVFMLMLSEKAQKSQWISKEVSLAIGDNKGILPLQLEACSLTDEYTYYLTNVQIYPLFEDEEEVMEEVAERIREIMDLPVEARQTAPKKPEPIKPKKPVPLKSEVVKPQRPVKEYSETDEKPYVYISHAEHDTPKVREIVTLLEEVGLRIWMSDPKRKDFNYTTKCSDMLEKCTSVICFISNDYDRAPRLQDELAYAMHIGKPTVNVYLEDVNLLPAISMRLIGIPAIHLNRCRNEVEMVKELVKIPELSKCRD